jgi:hypothetical protein
MPTRDDFLATQPVAQALAELGRPILHRRIGREFLARDGSFHDGC